MTLLEQKFLNNLQTSPHALILQAMPCCDLENFLTQYCQKILKLYGCENKKLLQKIANRTYYDLLEFDGLQQKITKPLILQIEEQFQKFCVEETGVKFCILKAFELANEAADNAFLRFLEEPTTKTHFILVTEAIEQLPPTIVSRCQRLILKTDWSQIPENSPYVFAFRSVQEWQTFQTSKLFSEIDQWIQKFQAHNHFSSVAETFKKWDYPTIALVCGILAQMGTRQFQKTVIELRQTIPMNPTKSLFLFTLWEAWVCEQSVL